MSESSREEKSAALLVASLASFLTPYMSSTINVALPAIESAFKVNAILITWIATAYLLGTAVFLIPFGRLADILGRKKIFLRGIILFTTASFLCGLSNTIYILILLCEQNGNIDFKTFKVKLWLSVPPKVIRRLSIVDLNLCGMAFKNSSLKKK